ncbi:hypothetical protein B7494_g7568 [Chlorociboria aeruginascens]|nr:hypothetical protein B7494_g7568 [Chlorociboria aeruginascens]
MSHARIEEVSDSDIDSDPSEGDIDDLDEDFDEREILKQRGSGPRPSQVPPPKNASSLINPDNIPSSSNTPQITTARDGTQFHPTTDDSKYKDFQCIYPVYFDANRSRAQGRRVGTEQAVGNPLAREIVAACGRLGLETLFEPMKTHPKDWANPGRVKVRIKGGNNPMVKNKHHLYTLISKHLQANPTTAESAMRVRIPGVPPPNVKKGYPEPAIPKGWKMGTILPYYSPAMTGGGVSENFMKDMMAEMQGVGMPDYCFRFNHNATMNEFKGFSFGLNNGRSRRGRSGAPSPSPPNRSRESFITVRDDSPDPTIQLYHDRQDFEMKSNLSTPQTDSSPLPRISDSRKHHHDDDFTAYNSEPKRPERRRSLQVSEILDFEKMEEPEERSEIKYGDVKEVVIQLEEELAQFNDQFREEVKHFQRQKDIPFRNKPYELPFAQIATFEWNGTSLRPRKSVELVDGTFLRIKVILQNQQTDEVVLRGWKMKRTRLEGGLLPKKLNELCLVYDVDLDDERQILEQGVHEISLSEIVQIRRIIFTNRPFPACSWRESTRDLPDMRPDKLRKYIEDHEGLVVRWKYTTKFDTAFHRVNNYKYPRNYRQKQLEPLAEEECTSGLGISDRERRYCWRGETKSGGAGRPRRLSISRPRDDNQFSQDPLHCPECRKEYLDYGLFQQHVRKHYQPDRASQLVGGIDRQLHGIFKSQAGERDEDEVFIMEKSGGDRGSVRRLSRDANNYGNPPPRNIQRYSYGDMFCCGGGMTRGAEMAGLDVALGLDLNSKACDTWRLNFPEAQLFEMEVDKFLALSNENRRFLVDILHLSPPCQPHSSIYTVEGKNHDQNVATLSAIDPLLRKMRPRIATLEETSGILTHNKVSGAFNTIVRMFVDQGYSVSWQLVDFQNFGLAQRRKRLIIVASCPGEPLPDFPKYTHSEHGQGGLRTFNSVRNAISGIPPNTPNHNIQALAPGPYVTWDDSGIINAILCNGTPCKHPNGRREFTERELARLSGFPDHHEFLGSRTVVKGLIGNAVPPSIGKILFESIIQHLKAMDAREQREDGAPDEVVALHD